MATQTHLQLISPLLLKEHSDRHQIVAESDGNYAVCDSVASVEV